MYFGFASSTFGYFWAFLGPLNEKKNQATNRIVYLLYFGFFFGVRPDLVAEEDASGVLGAGALGPFLMTILAFLGPFWTTKSSNLSSLPRPRLRNLKEKVKFKSKYNKLKHIQSNSIAMDIWCKQTFFYLEIKPLKSTMDV